MKTVYLLRGVSGAGKSTLAQTLMMAHSDVQVTHIEADMFFYGVDGKYNFDHTKLSSAHQWCFDRFSDCCEYPDTSVVICSNTFTTKKEIQRYIDKAKEHNCKLVVLTVEKCHDSENVHNVPSDVLLAQRKRFELL